MKDETNINPVNTSPSIPAPTVIDEGQSYFFPITGKTIVATSLEEAQKKLAALLKNNI